MTQPLNPSPAFFPPPGQPVRFGQPEQSANQVPRAFQLFLAIYVLVTGDLPTAIQGALFGVEGGAEAEFAAAMLASIVVDLMLIAPVLFLAGNRLGLLHPLLLAVVVWPLLIRMPSVVEEFGVWASLLLGEQVGMPFYSGLGWRPAPEVWMAIAKFNVLVGLSLGATYLGFGLWNSRQPLEDGREANEFRLDSLAVRRILAILILVSSIALALFIQMRGGLAEHIGDLARGRFRSLAGQGPFVALADLGVIAVLLWIAIRPSDAKSPFFIACLIAVAATQFLSNGSRVGALSVFMLAGLMWALRTRKIPWRLALMIAPVVFFMLGALSVVRSSGLTNESAAGAVSSRSASEILTEVREEIQLRSAISAAVPVVEDGYEVTNGPMWGRTYIAAILGFVPRSVWEEKPRGPGSLYAQLFLGEMREGTAIPVPATAEVYWNFGVAGILVIFLIYGGVIRQVHVFYARRRGNPFILCFYLLFLTTCRPSTDELVLFQQQVLMLLFAYGAVRFFSPASGFSGRSGGRQPDLIYSR